MQQEQKDGFQRKGRCSLSEAQRAVVQHAFKSPGAEELTTSGLLKARAVLQRAKEDQAFGKLFQELREEQGLVRANAIIVATMKSRTRVLQNQCEPLKALKKRK